MQLRAGHILPANGCASAYRRLGSQGDGPPPPERFGTQWYFREFWCAQGKCGNAAVPGTSNHGSFLFGAVDTNPSTVVPVINRLGAPFGWCKMPQTVRGVSCFSDASHEPWHVRYTPAIFGGRRNPCVVREGDTDACVRGLKRRLRAHGGKGFKAGPHYGASLRRAVIRFQANHKLAGDGVPGPATWKQLYRKVPPVKPPRPLPPAPPNPGPIPPVPPKPEPSRPAKCIDVSQHNGSVDWDAVDKAGYDCAWFKSTEGQDFRDRTFSAARVAECRQQLGKCGPYHFLRPRAGRSGAVEARWYIRTAKAAGVDWRRGHDLRPVLDVEENALATPAQTCRYVRQAVNWIWEKVHRRTMIYTFPAFGTKWLGCLRAYVNKAKVALWIAHVGVPQPVIPMAWLGRGYSVWQHSWKGRVSGVPGDVDLNITTTKAIRALAAR